VAVTSEQYRSRVARARSARSKLAHSCGPEAAEVDAASAELQEEGRAAYSASGAGRAPAAATAAHAASAAVGEGAKSSPAAPSADELAELDALVRQSDGAVVEVPAEAAIGTSGDFSSRSSGSELGI
jgi:hypothetical protein